MANVNTEISRKEWSLLDRLTSEAGMDWFFGDTTHTTKGDIPGVVAYEPKGFLTGEQAESSSCAFMAENFWKFSDEEIKEMRDCLIRCGIPEKDLDYEMDRWQEMKSSR